jgi:hypothetical protein
MGSLHIDDADVTLRDAQLEANVLLPIEVLNALQRQSE